MTPTRNDLPRLLSVTVSLVLCIVGSMWGSGVFGGPSVPEAADGALRADATLIAPGGSAFVIWSLIYFGLAAYTIWQWLPAQRASDRHRVVGWWIAASMILNAVWLLTVRADQLWLSVVVILVLAIVLGRTLTDLARLSPVSLTDRIVTDGTVGVYLGWVSVATCANITATLVDAEVGPSGRAAEWIAVAVLAVALTLAVVLARVSRGSLGVGLAMAWGLGWIAAERLGGAPESSIVGAAAIVAAVGALGAAAVARLRSA